jgi:hypothetical protein
MFSGNMQQLTYWYLEFEAYKIDGNFFVKEIAILKGDRTQCYTYYIKQHAVPPPVSSEEYQLQKSLLGLAWSYGEHSFEEAMTLIKEKTAAEDLIFVSSAEARYFLSQYLAVTYQPCEIGFEMIHCPSENCDVRHGDQCARRKVHELRYADNHEL